MIILLVILAIIGAFVIGGAIFSAIVGHIGLLIVLGLVGTGIVIGTGKIRKQLNP